MTIEPICEDEVLADSYIWHIDVNGVGLVVDRDSPDKLRVRTGHAGESAINLQDVHALIVRLCDIRDWMIEQQRKPTDYMTCSHEVLALEYRRLHDQKVSKLCAERKAFDKAMEARADELARAAADKHKRRAQS
jgi:hypothetical protein